MRTLSLFLGLVGEARYLLLRVVAWIARTALAIVVISVLMTITLISAFLACAFYLFLAPPSRHRE
jgi:hypothetical protein